MVPDDRASSMGASSFDFNSQAGVLAVLGAIRTSELAPADKNELRDLVFLYSNGGGDPAVRTVLEERLREAGIVAVSPLGQKIKVTTLAHPVVRSGFTGGRPVPVFSPATQSPVTIVSTPVVPVAAPTPTPTPTPVSTPSVVVAAPAPVRITPVVPEAPAPIVVPDLDVVIAKPTPVAIPEPVSVPAPQPVRPVVVVPPPVRPVPITPISPIVPESVTVAPVTPPVVPPPVPIVEPPAPATTARLERIRVIKSDVNNRVGNPVNLVAMDKAIGSEYMSALLESMKLLSSASDVESERAMVRLEASYAAVVNLLSTIAVSNTAVPTPTTSVPSAVPAPVPERIVPTVAIPEPVSSWGDPEPVVPVRPVGIPQRPNMSGSPVVPIIPPVAPTAVPVVPQPPVQSVAASQAPLRSITELPTADEVNHASVTGDPLFTKEVDSGLQQLLSEWSLFKKSGLFGTGPSGREHPLFVKMAPLALPLLLAGRFEGSTQEIKQSITDYMNGWRYEQGIVYEKDETFEHYLRRVIRHIIDLQNKKRGA